MCRAARIYGYFVPPKDWIPMVSQRLLAQASETDLMVLSHIIIGSDPQLLRGELEDLAMTLQDDSVALTLNVSFAQCGNYRNLLSHFLVNKNFLKATFVLKKLLKC